MIRHDIFQYNQEIKHQNVKLNSPVWNCKLSKSKVMLLCDAATKGIVYEMFLQNRKSTKHSTLKFSNAYESVFIKKTKFLAG
jgi:hypothetical protein